MVSILKLFYKLPDRNKKQSTSIDFFLTYITFESNLLDMKYFILTVCTTLVLSCSSKAKKSVPSNAANFNDTALPKFIYAAGQALFDKTEPYKLIERTDSYFIYPDKDYEKVGEINEVCFVEGLVFFKEKWFLYYGTADSKIAVAVYDPSTKK